jgi:hypothetical protein
MLMDDKLGVMDKSVTKKAWKPMKVSSIGKATDLIKTGGGKLSLAGGDPGEGKKQKAG